MKIPDHQRQASLLDPGQEPLVSEFRSSSGIRVKKPPEEAASLIIADNGGVNNVLFSEIIFRRGLFNFVPVLEIDT